MQRYNLAFKSNKENAPYCDACWMETASAGLAQAKEFAEDVLSRVPHLMLAYNNSPSFNWDKSGMTDEQMKTFKKRLRGDRGRFFNGVGNPGHPSSHCPPAQAPLGSRLYPSF